MGVCNVMDVCKEVCTVMCCRCVNKWVCVCNVMDVCKEVCTIMCCRCVNKWGCVCVM